MINDVLNILHQIQKSGTEVVIAWIPGNVEITGNEEVDIDRLAGNAAASETTSMQEAAVSKIEAKTITKHHCIRLLER